MPTVIEKGYAEFVKRVERLKGLTDKEVLAEFNELTLQETMIHFLMPHVLGETKKRGIVTKDTTPEQVEELIEKTLGDSSGDHQAVMFRGGEGVKH